jgi:DNA-binding Lrp family transcriptional regulator
MATQNIFSMDRLDRRILDELQKDGGLSNAELAAKVGSTAPSCWRRIKQMEDAGVLLKTVRLADRKALGQTVNVVCNVRMSSHSTESIQAFEDLVHGEPCVLECYSMSGEWDYLLQIVTRDVESYEAFLMRRLLKHPSVASAASHFALRVVKYSTALPCSA